jgi:uncharacterized protein (TIGR00369 family)
MTPLEKIQSMKMPFADLKGVTFVEATMDRVVARMLVRPDLCTVRNTIHGGAVMAFADSVGAAATVVNLPTDANGTTTLESKTNFIGGAKEGTPELYFTDPDGLLVQLQDVKYCGGSGVLGDQCPPVQG